MANDLEIDLLDEIDEIDDDRPDPDLDLELDELTLNCCAVFNKIGVAIKNGTAVTLTEKDISFLKQTGMGDYCLMSLESQYRRH